MNGFEITVIVGLALILAIGIILIGAHISLQTAIKDVEQYIDSAVNGIHRKVGAVESNVTDAVTKVERKVTDLAPKATAKVAGKATAKK